MKVSDCKYYAVAVDSNGTQYKLSKITTDLSIDEQKNGIADKAQLSCFNVKIETGSLYEYINVGMRLFIFVNDGSEDKEIFRGVIWSKKFKDDAEKEVSYVAYTNLIYLQKSKDCVYYSSGKTTESIIKNICSRWSVSCTYEYESITHPKTPLNNKLISDMIVEILDKAKEQKGTKYVIRSEKDIMLIKKYGSNNDIYCFSSKKAVMNVNIEDSMDDLVTQVIIVGKKDDNDRAPIEATVKGNNIKQYGTLQTIVERQDGTTLSEAKTEANTILKEKGKISKTYSLTAIDVPFVHKGDIISADTSKMTGYYYVTAVSHDAVKNTMQIEAEEV